MRRRDWNFRMCSWWDSKKDCSPAREVLATPRRWKKSDGSATSLSRARSSHLPSAMQEPACSTAERRRTSPRALSTSFRPSASIGPSSRSQNTISRATTAASAGFPSTETTNRFPRARQGRARREEAILPWCRRQRKKRQRCSFPRARWCSTRRSGAAWC